MIDHKTYSIILIVMTINFILLSLNPRYYLVSGPSDLQFCTGVQTNKISVIGKYDLNLKA